MSRGVQRFTAIDANANGAKPQDRAFAAADASTASTRVQSIVDAQLTAHALSATDTNVLSSAVSEREHALVWCSQEARRDASSEPTRIFLVGTLDELVAWYERTPSYARHAYEIVRDGAPCHWYMDLECALDRTPTFRASLALARIVDASFDALARDFGIVDRRRIDVRMLDASTVAKFSVHLIARIDGGRTALANNQVLGDSVRRLATRLLDEDAAASGGVERLDSVRTYDSDPPRSCIDLGVYSRNRQLRLYASSKFGDAERVMRVAPYRSNALGDVLARLTDVELERASAINDDEYMAAACAWAARDFVYDRRTLLESMCSLVDADATLLHPLSSSSAPSSSSSAPFLSSSTPFLSSSSSSLFLSAPSVSSSSLSLSSSSSSLSSSSSSLASSSSSSTKLSASTPPPSLSSSCSSSSSSPPPSLASSTMDAHAQSTSRPSTPSIAALSLSRRASPPSSNRSASQRWDPLPSALFDVAERALAAHYGRAVALNVGSSAYNAREHLMRVRATDERYCPLVAREHRSNGGALVIDLRQRRMRHLCYSHHCANTHAHYAPTPAALDSALDAYCDRTPSLHRASSSVVASLSRSRRRQRSTALSSSSTATANIATTSTITTTVNTATATDDDIALPSAKRLAQSM